MTDTLIATPKELGTLIKVTNKAEIFCTSDGFYIKRYFTADAKTRVQQDQKSLNHIHAALGTVQRNGWIYRCVRPIWFDAERALVCMEKAHGRVISELPKGELFNSEYHAGVWLALYHNRLLDRDMQGKVYTDLTVHNILVDSDRKTVIAIDPGAMWDREGCGFEDIVKHIHSITVGLIAKRRVSLGVVFLFLEGYREATDFQFRWIRYYKSLFKESRRQFSNYRKSSAVRSLMFPIWFALFSPIFFLFIPGYLSRSS